MQSLKCDQCGSCFVRKCGLASDLRTHEKARLDCTGCHFVADDKETLEQHCRTCEFIGRTAAPSTPVSRRKTPKKENVTPKPMETPKPETPKPPEQDAESSKRSRKKVNLSPPTAISTKTEGVNENSAPPSRKVSFVLPKSEPKPKTAHLPAVSTPKPPKPPRAPTGLENKKKEEEPPCDGVKESLDAYFPLPPGSKWAPPGGDPGFPERVEVDLKTPLMEQSKNRLVPSWLVFVDNPKNNFVRPAPVESSEPKKDPLEPPKLEDFYKIPGCFGQERHPVEAIDFYERALEEYDRMMETREFAQREAGPPPILRAREYLKRKAEIEESRECPDCPYKKSDLTKFRAHRDRHELGGLVKCSQCNYGSHSRVVTHNHMFFDHYLNDVKVLEGLPSSDSDVEEVEDAIEFVPKPVSQKKKSRKRRRNW
ncbi:hypothetical protein CAEBREN_02787 [Caenorhabditis brenneri]|uniref:C2H2-type domain-containing protein n=1 Tax=Caenorhabditis brenneri TaxID=135651 RepID=G0MDE0_CAEBE|nr:hypothetical protein CAEBREN_02787 [Caenorhabditis brenneri]